MSHTRRLLCLYCDMDLENLRSFASRSEFCPCNKQIQWQLLDSGIPYNLNIEDRILSGKYITAHWCYYKYN